MLEQTAAQIDGNGAGGFARILHGVVAEVPDDLMQMRRIHAHDDIGRDVRAAHRTLEELERLLELAAKLVEPRSQLDLLRLRLLATREREHALHNLAHTRGIDANDVGQSLLRSVDLGRFRKQLTRMTHGADGVTDLVSDTRRQAAE